MINILKKIFKKKEKEPLKGRYVSMGGCYVWEGPLPYPRPKGPPPAGRSKPKKEE